MDNWENLRFYLAVARQGTVTAAAKELHVSHATVLRRIEQLEGEIGARLFKKLQTGYELTEIGAKLMDRATELERGIDEMVMQAQGEDEAVRGVLRVAQPESDTLNLYPLLSAFTQRFPEISLELHSSNALAKLNQQEVDVAIRMTDTPPDLLVGRCLGTVDFALHASKDYLSQFADITDLSQFHYVHWTQGSRESSWLQRVVPEARIALHSSSRSDVISAIRAHMGVGFISTQVAKSFPELLRIPAASSAASFKLWVLTHRDLRNQARVVEFMRFLTKAF